MQFRPCVKSLSSEADFTGSVAGFGEPGFASRWKMWNVGAYRDATAYLGGLEKLEKCPHNNSPTCAFEVKLILKYVDLRIEAHGR